MSNEKVSVKIKDPEPVINIKFRGWDNVCAINVLLTNDDIVREMHMSDTFKVTNEIDSLIYLHDHIGMKEEKSERLKKLVIQSETSKKEFPSKLVTTMAGTKAK